ncbi:MBL fold metallo-hydrolase [Cryptosporangium sp. NPDC048952]|uniref:MBL fold metallo-hydrolase n=1 Tax=Cryptosporangium sp. NPDC048952 TaxID=3363961 RepID=UPI0037191833
MTPHVAVTTCCEASSPRQAGPEQRPSDNVTRRSLLAAGGIGAVGALLPGVPAAAQSEPVLAAAPKRGAAVVLLGTQGGPPPNPDRAGIATALTVDGATYLVDAGRMAVSQYVAVGLAWADLRAVFVTHLHADHVAELFQIFLLGGFQAPGQGDTLTGPIPVYGPGAAGGLAPPFGGGQRPTTNPGDPTPGLAGFFEHASAAFAYSTNVFMRDSGIRETRSLAAVHELAPPAGASYQDTAPAMAPFTVMEDDRVRVTAVLVPHGPVFPAFAYRFETDYGAVTFSGDTTAHANLVRLAHGSNVLVHEAINVQGWAGPAAIKDHLLQGHVEVQKVGAVAQSAGAEHLVLSHIGDMAEPRLNEAKWRRWAQRGYTGRVTVGRDRGIVPVR